MKSLSRFLPLAGRILIGGIFVMSGVSKLSTYNAITGAISAVGLPFPPLGWALAMVVEIGFGALLLIGFQARLAAWALAAWCVVTAVLFHSNFADQNMMLNFLKNIMIAGGLLQIAYFGPGPASVDARRSTVPA